MFKRRTFRTKRTIATLAVGCVVAIICMSIAVARSRNFVATREIATPSTATTMSPAPELTVPSTTSATNPTPVNTSNDDGCRFTVAAQPTNVAFCETFDNASPASRSGQLNEELWGVSRLNTYANSTQGEVNRFYPATLRGCGAPQIVFPPNDVKICNGRLVEAGFDAGGQLTLAMYPKQPFDISGDRTGTIVFDVSANAAGAHNAWPELWWTDQPVPAPTDHRSTQGARARNSVGVIIAATCPAGHTGVERISVTRNYVLEELPFVNPVPWSADKQQCIKAGSVDGELNHFEVRISQSRIEVWATEPGSPTLQLIAVADNANVTMTKGLPWMEHATYNGCKYPPEQCDWTFAWDNFGFDGPKTYRDLSFDVADALLPSRVDGTIDLGYVVTNTPRSFSVPNVFRRQTPTSALVTFNWLPTASFIPSFRLNGGEWHDTPWSTINTDVAYEWKTIGVNVAVSEIRDGDNVIEFKNDEPVVVSNINVILVAGARVP